MATEAQIIAQLTANGTLIDSANFDALPVNTQYADGFQDTGIGQWFFNDTGIVQLGRGGGRCIQHHISPGNPSSPDEAFYFTSPGISVELFFRFYVKYESGYIFAEDPNYPEGAWSGLQKLMYFDTNSGSTVWRIMLGTWRMNHETGQSAQPDTVGCINFDNSGHNIFHPNVAFVPILSNTWYYVEMALVTTGASTNRMRIWVAADGQPATLTHDYVNFSNPNWSSSFPVNSIFSDDHYGGNPGGSTNNKNIWKDDFILARQFVGPSSTTTPPQSFSLPGGAGAAVYSITGSATTLNTPLAGPTLIGFIHRA